MPGLFLSLDGIDGTGKSTQCRLLADWLTSRGYSVKSVIDPGGTPLGGKLRKILLHGKGEISPRAEALLFMASRAELVATEILPALQSGSVVVSDRYLLSTVVYQGYGAGLPVEELRSIGNLATGGVYPQAIFLLDLPVEEAMKRRNAEPDRVESRKLEFHQRVRAGFLREAEQDPTTIRLVDAQASIEAIQKQIRDHVEPLLADLKR